MVSFIQRLSAWLTWLADALSRVTVALFAVLILTSVITRYVFNAPLSWSEEVARGLLVWMVFLAGSVCVKHAEHVGFDVLVKRLKPGTIPHGLLVFVCNAAIAAMSVILLVYGTRLTMRTMGQTTSVLRISQAWLYLAIPVGAALSLVHTGALAADWLERRRRASAMTVRQ